MPAVVTIQPYREEINRIISTYIMDGSPRQVNLSDRDRKAVMHALSYTTHPSALRLVIRSVESSLRHQNHPNFVRWSICNGNPPRISFARYMGWAGVFNALVIAILLTLSRANRGWRATAIPVLFLGAWAVVASYSGMCICMHIFSRHHQHIRPWDLFEHVEEVAGLRKQSYDSIGSSNSFEEEPWIAKYSERNLVRKILDREILIQEPVLRQIHDTIFVQAMLAGLVASLVFGAVFLPLPPANLF